MRSVLDEIVICLAVFLGFFTALCMVILNEIYGFKFYPSLIAFFASVSVAALIYRFLGGTGEAQFKMGVLQLTGSAAVLVGMTWFLGNKIQDQMGILANESLYRPKIAGLESELQLLRSQYQLTISENVTLKSKAKLCQDDNGKDILADIKSRDSSDGTIREIKRMCKNGSPPFLDTIKSANARITLIEISRGYYWICKDFEEALNKDIENPTGVIRFTRSISVNSEPLRVEAKRGGYQDPKVCANNERNFDIQLGCDDLQEIFPDKITSCIGKRPKWTSGDIRGEQVSIAPLAPE